MSEDTPGNLTVIWGKVKVVLPWAVVAAIGTAVGYLLLPKNDDDVKVDDAIPTIQKDITEIKVTQGEMKRDIAWLVKAEERRVEKPSRPKYANGDE